MYCDIVDVAMSFLLVLSCEVLCCWWWYNHAMLVSFLLSYSCCCFYRDVCLCILGSYSWSCSCGRCCTSMHVSLSHAVSTMLVFVLLIVASAADVGVCVCVRCQSNRRPFCLTTANSHRGTSYHAFNSMSCGQRQIIMATEWVRNCQN